MHTLHHVNLESILGTHIRCVLNDTIVTITHVTKVQRKGFYYSWDLHKAARAGNLSALQDAIRRGKDVNSVDGVSWFVGM